MLYLDDLKYMKLYKKQFYLPIVTSSKRKKSAILLLSPDYESSVNLMNNKFSINRNGSFISYYAEKDIMYTINQEGNLICEYNDDTELINESSNANNVFRETTDVTIFDNDEITDTYMKIADDKLVFYNEMYDEELLNEAQNHNVNNKYKRLLYNDRIRNNKVIFNLYERVKKDNKWIRKTFIKYDKYKSLNLFIDLHYYNQVYLNNNNFTMVKSIDMYFEFIKRFINDKRISNAGYTKRTIFVPIDGWKESAKGDLLDFRSVLNPLSVFYKKLRYSPEEITNAYGDIDFIFFGEKGYFKFNPNNIEKTDYAKFSRLINKLKTKEEIVDDHDENDNSPMGITTSIIDKLETNKGIVIDDISVKRDRTVRTIKPDGFNKVDIQSKTSKAIVTKSITKLNNDSPDISKPVPHMVKSNPTTIDTIKTLKTVKKDSEPEQVSDMDEDTKEQLKEELVKKIMDKAENSADEEETLNKMNEDEDIKRILADLVDDADEGIKLSPTRVNRINKAQDDFMKKKYNNTSVSDIVNNSNRQAPLPETSLPIKSINDEWKHLKSINFEKEYDLDADIIKCLNSLSDINKHYPISILSVDKTDTSTSEDSIYTFSVKIEDYAGKRSTLKFDIPKFRENRFMRLRGNEKIFSIEMPLLPISKTESDTVQIVSLYNKIFIMTYNTSLGKSNHATANIIKALSKYDKNDIKVSLGDNSRICQKYELPIDYLDLASVYNKIEIINKDFKDNITIYFNQDEIRSIDGINLSKGIPVAVQNDGTVYYYNSNDISMGRYIAKLLCSSADFNDCFYEVDKKLNDSKTTYSRAKIGNTLIPIIVILAHDIGLTKAMDIANIKYNITDSRNPKVDNLNEYDRIKFSDGYIFYEDNYYSSMLMNGLKDCSTETISIKDLNSKMTWVTQLDNFGSRIKSDQLDNFNDLMMDPVTKEVCKDYNLPTDYHDALIYASNLLIDNKFTGHTDLSTNRYRTNEVVAAVFYNTLAMAYGNYAIQNKHGRKTTISIKQSAVIDAILELNTTSDLSVFQPLQEIETKNQISTKGAQGLNQERAYNDVRKRGYDDSMVNIIAQSTGFASTVGLNRQTTINPNIVGGRGYFVQSGIDEMNLINTLGMTEALTPFMLTSDDPFRNDMTFVQTSKHTTPIEYSSPLLVTTGADAAMPYLVSDMFAHKAKKKGTVSEVTDKYLLVTYDDNTTEYVNLEEQTKKNSSGGFYITLQLKTDLKVGDKVKENTILAYDKKSFSKDRVQSGQLAYNIGCLAKVAMLTTEDGYEDSGVCSEWLSEAMASDIVVMDNIPLNPSSIVYYLVKKGQLINEGDPILIFQNAYDEEDANLLLKSLNNDDGDVSEIGRTVIKSKVTGEICDIKLYRTCEIDELSESLRKIVVPYENSIKKLKKVASAASNEVIFDSTEKLPQVGKLKKVEGILIEIYMRYHDKLSVGDKLSSNANKVVLMDIYSDNNAPYTDFRPNEAIDQICSQSALDGRMITSIIKSGALNKCMVELSRAVCDIMGVKWKDIHEMRNDELKKIK